MRGGIVSKIRKQHNLNQADLAKILGVSLRTITNWEGRDAELPIAIAHQLRTTYQDRYLKDILEKTTEEAFAAVPSELVNVWVVERTQCILFVGGDRIAQGSAIKKGHSFDPKEKRDVQTPTLLIPLEQEGLTTFPLKTGITLNEHLEGITNHKHKRHKGTNAAIYSLCGMCRSLLYIPMFEPSGWGPIPVFLLCFQNKLTAEFELPTDNPPRYDDKDEIRGRKIAEANKEEIVNRLRELDMFEANRQI